MLATGHAALNAFRWFGCGDKNAADAAACDAICGMFDLIDVCGEVVIGSGAEVRHRARSELGAKRQRRRSDGLEHPL